MGFVLKRYKFRPTLVMRARPENRRSVERHGLRGPATIRATFHNRPPSIHPSMDPFRTGPLSKRTSRKAASFFIPKKSAPNDSLHTYGRLIETRTVGIHFRTFRSVLHTSRVAVAECALCPCASDVRLHARLPRQTASIVWTWMLLSEARLRRMRVAGDGMLVSRLRFLLFFWLLLFLR